MKCRKDQFLIGLFAIIGTFKQNSVKTLNYSKLILDIRV